MFGNTKIIEACFESKLVQQIIKKYSYPFDSIMPGQETAVANCNFLILPRYFL